MSEHQPDYVTIPGWEGSIGPSPAQYGKPHVYARDVTSGAGNCVCAAALGDARHAGRSWRARPGQPPPRPAAGGIPMTESTPPEATAKTAPAEKCRDLKRGRVDLHCTLPRGHADGKDGTWHEAMYTDHQMITYDGATHTVHVTEHVTWEPLDHVREAVKHLMAGRRDDG